MIFAKFGLCYFKLIAMKKTLLFLFASVVLISCSVMEKIVEIDDPYKEVNRMKMTYSLRAFSEEKTGWANVSEYLNLSMVHLFEVDKNGKAELLIDFQIVTPIRAEELDSVIYLNLDGEKIKIVGNYYQYKQFDRRPTSTTPADSVMVNNDKTLNIGQTQITPASKTFTVESGSYQLMHCQFTVPENLWVSVATSSKIGYRFYIGKEGFDGRLNRSQIKKLKYFFELALCKRDANLPPASEGQKKL
jgi:hypothetical protein